jgi:hypothetical protein
MKVKLLRVLTAITAGSGALAAFSAGGLGTFVPAQYAPLLAGVALAALAVKEAAVALGDRVDDGESNGSFKG